MESLVKWQGALPCKGLLQHAVTPIHFVGVTLSYTNYVQRRRHSSNSHSTVRLLFWRVTLSRSCACLVLTTRSLILKSLTATFDQAGVKSYT